MRKFIIAILLFLSHLSWAMPHALNDSAQIYLLTCTPGTQVWSKYGHTGIRVVDRVNDMDIVFNYGIFDLTADDFYIKFVHGETYYQLGIEPYRYFDKFYKHIGRITYWQELNLTPVQKQRIFDALLVNYQPTNRYYLYNFVFDNCATRPYYLIKNALQDTLISTYKGFEGTTFREAITHYTGKNSWVDFGINLVFGRDADIPMTNEERLFLPEELMYYVAEAQLSDGTPLVKNQYIHPFRTNIVPWYANCWWGIALFALLMLAVAIYDRRRNSYTWGIDLALGIVYLLLISLVIFLTKFSCHPLVGFNWRLLLFPAIHISIRVTFQSRLIKRRAS